MARAARRGASQATWGAQWIALAVAKPFVRTVTWLQASDALPHIYPHGGLFRADQTPKPLVPWLQSLRDGMSSHEDALPPSRQPLIILVDSLTSGDRWALTFVMFDDFKNGSRLRLPAVPRQRRSDRSEHAGRPARGPHGAAGSRRQLQRRPGVHGAGSPSRRSGPQVIKSIRPEQQIVKIVHDELIELMGPVDPSIRFEKTGPDGPDALRPAGLGQDDDLRQARPAAGRPGPQADAGRRRPPAPGGRRAAQGHRRPGRRAGLQPGDSDPVTVCQQALVEANRSGCDTLILDTAGRLHVDDELMAELAQIEKKVKPHQVFFVCDAMTGQDAVASADAFNKALELDGVILTKLDGDARGGAALSVRKVTGVPIKFVGKGEKLDRLEPFDPERLVGQMLGMGDIVGLVEAAQSAVDAEEAQRQQEKLAKGKFDLDDFRKQIVNMKKMGSMRELMSKIPGLNQMSDGRWTASTPTRRSSGSRG